MVAGFHDLNLKCSRGGIVFAGSSLMEMFPVEKWSREYADLPPVYNRGVGGYTTQDYLPVIDVCVTELQPRKLFINIGTNDLSDPAETIEAMIARLEQMLSVIIEKVPDIRIYLMAYYPVNAQAASPEMKAVLRIRTNEKIQRANLALQTLAERMGLEYIDVNAPLTDEQGRLKKEYTLEGMHIREEGYRAIFPEILSFMRQA